LEGSLRVLQQPLLFFERLPIPPKGPYNHAFLEAFLARFLAPH
jgi:hypothetical protein